MSSNLLRILFCILFLSVTTLHSPHVYAQDDDFDLEAEEPGDFDDLEQELDQANKAPSAPEAAAPKAAESLPAEVAPKENATATPPAEDDLAGDELDLDDDEKAAEQPPAPVEEEKQAEEVPPVIEPEQKEEIAEPAPIEVAPEEPKEEQAAEPAVPVEEPKADNDTPDEEFEARLSRIYKQFYASRVTDTEWFQIIGPKASEKYTVQNGDSLWGISQTFFGNGFFWPKLWQLNADYTNPHVLEVADSIQFSPGSVAVEPTINLTQTSSKFNEPDPPKASVTPEQAKAYMANVQMPPGLPFRPVINKIPPSLPRFEAMNTGYDRTGFSLKQVKRFDITDMAFLSASVSDSMPDSVGEIIEAETGGNLINVFQEAVVELDSAKEGERFYSFVVGEKIVNKFATAYPIEYQSEFEILQNLGGGKYRVLCLESISPASVGSKLRRGKLPRVNFGQGGTSANAKVTVFGGHYDSDRKQLGAGNIIYVNGGRSKGMQNGQLLSVLKNYQLRNPETNLKNPEEPIGLIKIINVTGDVATALVLESREDIRSGDLTGPGDIY